MPAQGRVQVTAVPRGVAEQIPKVESVAVISITAPEKPLANLAEFEHILRLSFADIDFLSGEMSKRSQTMVADAFTEEQAMDVLAFVQSLSENISTIVVHCEGGYSRSCTIAQTLHQIYGYSVNQEHLREANPSVLKLLLDSAAKKEKAPRRRLT